LPYRILHYLTVNGVDPFQEWLEALADRTARVAVTRRLNRMEAGNFGDHAHCRAGVRELRFDMGPGYRVYYTIAQRAAVLVLGGGDKRSQPADIDRACAYLADFKRRSSDPD